MKLITHQAELLSCFRPIDRPDVDGAVLPMDVAPAATWSLGNRAFIVFADGELPKGVVFHRDNSAVPAVATMCTWCHRVRGHGGVKMLSVRSGERRWVGQYLCADLDCLHQETTVDDLRESLDTAARTARTLARIRAFTARCIF